MAEVVNEWIPHSRHVGCVGEMEVGSAVGVDDGDGGTRLSRRFLHLR